MLGEPSEEGEFQTQQQQLEALLKGFGIAYTVEKTEKPQPQLSADFPNPNYPGAVTVLTVKVPSPRDRTPEDAVVGYGGFATEFAFNAQGQFVKMGIWE